MLRTLITEYTYSHRPRRRDDLHGSPPLRWRHHDGSGAATQIVRSARRHQGRQAGRQAGSGALAALRPLLPLLVLSLCSLSLRGFRMLHCAGGGGGGDRATDRYFRVYVRTAAGADGRPGKQGGAATARCRPSQRATRQRSSTARTERESAGEMATSPQPRPGLIRPAGRHAVIQASHVRPQDW